MRSRFPFFRLHTNKCNHGGFVTRFLVESREIRMLREGISWALRCFRQGGECLPSILGIWKGLRAGHLQRSAHRGCHWAQCGKFGWSLPGLPEKLCTARSLPCVSPIPHKVNHRALHRDSRKAPRIFAYNFVRENAAPQRLQSKGSQSTEVSDRSEPGWPIGQFNGDPKFVNDAKQRLREFQPRLLTAGSLIRI